MAFGLRPPRVFAGNSPAREQGASSLPGPETALPSTVPASQKAFRAQEAPLNFLLKHMESELRPCFRVDRESPKTKTPRRNKEVEEATKHYKGLGCFMHHVVRPLDPTL